MVLLSDPAKAQVTSNVLYRVVRIRTPSGLCSGFTIEVAAAQYLVTARHCLGDATGRTQIGFWHNETWKRLEGRVILPRSSTVDIAALTLAQPITIQYEFEPTDDGILLGQQLYFLGYPSGLATRGKLPTPRGFGELPFMKSGILSAMDSRNPEAIVLYVDGQNNLGFSGGPIVFRHSGTGRFRVAAVVSAYRTEALPVLKSKDLASPEATAYNDLYTQGNSGIVIGYSIQHIVEGIKTAKER